MLQSPAHELARGGQVSKVGKSKFIHDTPLGTATGNHTFDPKQFLKYKQDSLKINKYSKIKKSFWNDAEVKSLSQLEKQALVLQSRANRKNRRRVIERANNVSIEQI